MLELLTTAIVPVTPVAQCTCCASLLRGSMGENAKTDAEYFPKEAAGTCIRRSLLHYTKDTAPALMSAQMPLQRNKEAIKYGTD